MIYAKNSMMIVTKPQALIATLLLGASGHACALTLQNQEFSDAAIFTAVVNHFKKPLMHRFNPDAAGEHKPLLVLGPELKFGKKIMAPSFKHLTRQELVEQQQAVFYWSPMRVLILSETLCTLITTSRAMRRLAC